MAIDPDVLTQPATLSIPVTQSTIAIPLVDDRLSTLEDAVRAAANKVRNDGGANARFRASIDKVTRVITLTFQWYTVPDEGAANVVTT